RRPQAAGVRAAVLCRLVEPHTGDEAAHVGAELHAQLDRDVRTGRDRRDRRAGPDRLDARGRRIAGTRRVVAGLARGARGRPDAATVATDVARAGDAVVARRRVVGEDAARRRIARVGGAHVVVVAHEGRPRRAGTALTGLGAVAEVPVA